MEQQRVVALGFFDGVHRGHQAIVKKAVALAREKGMQAAVVTFENHPRAYVPSRKMALPSSQDMPLVPRTLKLRL